MERLEKNVSQFFLLDYHNTNILMPYVLSGYSKFPNFLNENLFCHMLKNILSFFPLSHILRNIFNYDFFTVFKHARSSVQNILSRAEFKIIFSVCWTISSNNHLFSLSTFQHCWSSNSLTSIFCSEMISGLK